MSIPEELSRLRDEKAEEYKKEAFTAFPNGYHVGPGENEPDVDFIIGFDACHSIMSEREKELEDKLQVAVESLTVISGRHETHVCDDHTACVIEARITLDKLGVK